MGTSHLKRLQICSLFGVATFLALGCSMMTRGFSRFATNSIRVKGPQTRQARTVAMFNRISAGQVYEVDVSFGPQPSLTLEAPKDLLPHLTATIHDGTLLLGANIPYSVADKSRVKAHIVVPRLAGVAISGAGRMVIKGQVRAGAFEASASGASHLSLSATVDSLKLDLTGASTAKLANLSAKSLDLRASGAPECIISGKVQSSSIESDGASQLHLKTLTTDRAVIHSKGASNTEIRVVADIQATASGASSVRFTGNPRQSMSASGASSIVNDH